MKGRQQTKAEKSMEHHELSASRSCSSSSNQMAAQRWLQHPCPGSWTTDVTTRTLVTPYTVQSSVRAFSALAFPSLFLLSSLLYLHHLRVSWTFYLCILKEVNKNPHPSKAIVSPLPEPIVSVQFSSVAQLCPTLWPHELQHVRPPCLSPTPGVHPNESVMPSSHLILCCPLLLLPPIPPQSGSFPMSQLFTWGGQSMGVSASASVLPVNIQDWFPLWWTGWISLQPKGLSRVFSKITIQKHLFFGSQLSL